MALMSLGLSSPRLRAEIASRPAEIRGPIPVYASHPPCLDGRAYCLPPDKESKAVALGHVRNSLEFGSQLWQIVVLLMILSTGLAGRLARGIEALTRRGWLQALLFSLCLVSVLFLFALLPIVAIGHACSLHYGISVQGWNSWLLDQLKSGTLTLFGGTPLLTLLYGLMHWSWSRRLYWFWAAVFCVPLMVLSIFLLPALVEPLFDHFEPLTQTHPELVRELERVVARTGTSIPPERMFLMKASAKSNGLNAYVTGIGASKRIVVWDTTADRMPQDEILFTFAHETGHYVLNHIPKGLVLGSVLLFPFFWLTANLATWMTCRWCAAWSTETLHSVPGLAVFVLALSILQAATEPIPNTISRHLEHQADVYGQEAIHGIVSDPQTSAVNAFHDLGEAYLDDPHPSPFLEFWTYDHPSIQTRATFAAHYSP